MRFETLHDWLSWQQTLHPREIDLGLERVREVASRLGLLAPGCPVITVAGTNGKGSTVAFLSAMLRAAGYRVGAYTSPHLLRYTERVRIDGAEIAEAELVASFARIDQARGEQSLTYFEFGTLAALDAFHRAGCEVLVLEVGLGGRLDAVNIIDADVAIITSIGLDHTDWLGPDRDSIGREKSGIARAGRPLVYGEPDLPAGVAAVAAELGAPLRLAGRDYRWQIEADGWTLELPARRLQLPAPALAGAHQYGNAAAAMVALDALGERLPVTPEALAAGLREASVAGRFQILPGPVEWVLDVAHNPDGLRVLTRTLAERPVAGRTLAVFAQMARKELEAVLQIAAPQVDAWYLLQLPDADARPAGEVGAALARLGLQAVASGPADALLPRVAADARPGDRVLVFGSFRTVEECLRQRADR